MEAPFTLIVREQAARFLSISMGTLDKLVREGVLPAPRRLGRTRLLYGRSDEFYTALARQLWPTVAPLEGSAAVAAPMALANTLEDTTVTPSASGAARPHRVPRRPQTGHAATTAVLRSRHGQNNLEAELNR
jgi:excisionase family DNA binding protein